MKLGISSYCLAPNMAEGKMTIFDVIDWAKDHGCEHIEFVPFYLPFVDEKNKCLNTDLIDQVREHCQKVDLEISTYSVNADLLIPDAAERRAEIERVKLHIDVAARLGIHWMRHDIANFRRPFSTNTLPHFNEELPLMVEGTRELCDYAASLGINTTLENHGFFCNGSERVLRIFEALERPNMKMTMDVGNFLCVDEYNLAAVKRCLHLAQIIHLKDFYIRTKEQLPSQNEMFNCNNGSWFETLGGQMIRGSIVGQGDLPIPEIIKNIKESGYDGYVSIEFEGMEPCERGTEISLNMARAFFGREIGKQSVPKMEWT
ncbi:MAG: sugar phosphate isomerase/epimerase [Lachnospiraceae bacterium]|jgi:inosose dehydratase|nr:sugar phosphate isomerase/epimerase [Lachnospiraceae bacterium]